MRLFAQAGRCGRIATAPENQWLSARASCISRGYTGIFAPGRSHKVRGCTGRQGDDNEDENDGGGCRIAGTAGIRLRPGYCDPRRRIEFRQREQLGGRRSRGLQLAERPVGLWTRNRHFGDASQERDDHDTSCRPGYSHPFDRQHEWRGRLVRHAAWPSRMGHRSIDVVRHRRPGLRPRRAEQHDFFARGSEISQLADIRCQSRMGASAPA